MRLLTTLEEQQLIEQIPCETREELTETAIEGLKEQFEDEILSLEADKTRLEEERDSLVDALIRVTVAAYIQELPEAKRGCFQLSAGQISQLEDGLEHSYITVSSGYYAGAFYDVIEHNGGRHTFTRSDK